MFEATIADAAPALLQGDIVTGVPLPLFGEQTLLAQSSAKKFKVSLDSVKDEHLESCDRVVLAIYRGPAVVLSQCCDIANADGRGRLLLSPVIPESDERFRSALGKQAYEAWLQDRELFVDTLLDESHQSQKSFQENEKLFNKASSGQIRKLWLGETIGAFPVAAVDGKLERGLCFFDGIVAIPNAWRNFVAGKRLFRLRPEWRMVLQESLRGWIGRFAFPGSVQDRLSDGNI